MKHKAQSFIEYVACVCIIVGALIAMQVYIKRGMQGHMKTYADQLSSGSTYSPKATYSYSSVSAGSRELTDLYAVDGGVENPRQNVTDSYLKSYRTTERIEEVLPFSNEPARR